jgi:hypothetical protein
MKGSFQLSRNKPGALIQTLAIGAKDGNDKEDCASIPSKPTRAPSIVNLATPLPQVSAFCQAVISRLLPKAFLGKNDIFKHNLSLLLRSCDRFVRLRRFESMSLHEVMQGMKVLPANKKFYLCKSLTFLRSLTLNGLRQRSLWHAKHRKPTFGSELSSFTNFYTMFSTRF